jgi:hypothetical protein
MPLVSKTFDQLLDFTRTTSATFVGSNGLIQNTPASVNLLKQTQQFDNAAWPKTAATVAANSTVAPDGTSTADTLVENTANGVHLVEQLIGTTSGSVTWSVYAKAAGRNWLMIDAYVGASNVCSFDLANGVVGTNNSGGTATITPVGNNWFCCTVTRTGGAGTYVVYRLANADNSSSYTGDGTSGIYLWGAQTEAAAAATTYTRNNGGVFPPRFDYDPVTLAPKGILIEEQRTNLFLYSQQFDNSNWAPTGATISANTTASPDGTVNADSLVEDTSLGVHRVYAAVACSASTAYTYTAYVKAAGRTEVRLLETTLGGATFNLSTIAVISTDAGITASIQDAGNGWRRCRITATTGVAQTLFVAQIQGSVAASSVYTGNGATALFLYGAQLEAGAFATSYIPTVASQVTRTGDQTSIVAPNFAPWYNPSEGSFVFEGSILGDKGATTVDFLQASDGVSNSIAIDLGMFGVAFPFFAVSNTTSQANLGLGTLTVNPPFKMAGAYKVNDFAGVLNGGTVQTDTSGTVPSSIAQLGLGTRLGGVYMNGHIRSVRYYPVRLSNAQLQALTA